LAGEGAVVGGIESAGAWEALAVISAIKSCLAIGGNNSDAWATELEEIAIIVPHCDIGAICSRGSRGGGELEGDVGSHSTIQILIIIGPDVVVGIVVCYSNVIPALRGIDPKVSGERTSVLDSDGRWGVVVEDRGGGSVVGLNNGDARTSIVESEIISCIVIHIG
jgi:hypothetical protein